MKHSIKFACVGLSLLVTVGCSWLNKQSTHEKLVDDVKGLEPQSTPGQTRLPDTVLPALPRGATRLELTPTTHLPVKYASSGRAFVPIEGLLSDAGFARVQANTALLKYSPADKTRQVEALLKSIVAKISAHAEIHEAYFAPDVGYFSGWIEISDYSALRSVTNLGADIFIAPRAQANARPHAVRSRTGRPLENTRTTGGEQYSGLERLGVGDFLQTVKTDLGETPTGERIRVGVTDTGVTYAHPAFRSSKSNNQRITYMKDFTNEGAGFVSLRAEVKLRREETGNAKGEKKAVPVLIDAQYLAPDALADGVLAVDENNETKLPFKMISNEKFILPEQLVKKIETPESGVRLGLISETAFASEDEKVDVNGNGRSNDDFFFFLIPGENNQSKVYIDFSGTKDFRAVKPIKDFNLNQETIDVVSEKIGLSISDVEIPVSSDTPRSESIVRIAMVGFDPGNHGSHVTGIIGAQKTLSNDSSDTQARGVAPEVELMVNRVCSNNSGCNATRAIIDLARNGARVINMSLGGLSATNDGYGVQETVIDRLTEIYNVLFLISAGNSGPGRQTVGSPSTARHALSVAATATQGMIEKQYQWSPQRADNKSATNSEEDFVMFFSSRGPTAAGGFKPNIAAPGTQLSTIQLNSSAGNRSGLDVYWGTSMAAPAATGAIALLMDAAEIYNAKNPSRPMPTDALTIRRVIMDSARPFRVSSYDPKTGLVKKGIYTWIDQGYGMVSLPQAWQLLKKKSAQELPSGVVLTDQGNRQSQNVSLDYKVRVLRPLGNGMRYDGMQTFDTGSLVGAARSERKFGQGIWLTEQEADNLLEIHFNRSLRLKELGHPQVGELLRQLNTSSESFALETIYYGSQSAWLKVGVSQSVSCAKDDVSQSSALTLLGAGAVDMPVDPDSRTALNPARASSLYLCLKKNLIADLPPGDHGAIIRAYKVVDGQRDTLASFEIPVYLTVPHHAASMQAKFTATQQVGSFMVDRHYVRVPKGVSVLRVSLELPKANPNDGGDSCSGVSLMVLAGGNTRTPADLAMSGSVAQNCSSLGAPMNNRLAVKFTELNPMPGIWDLHVFGRYQFPLSTYTLNIDYATFAAVPNLNLNQSTIGIGKFPLVLKESTFDAVPDAAKSQFSLKALLAQTQHEITPGQGVLTIPSANGKLARTYRADAGTVTITTKSSMEGLDIDLAIDECDDEELKACKNVARSGSATADERGVFLPKAGKFYAVRIDPYEVPADKAGFIATELINAHEPEMGRLQVEQDQSAAGNFNINYSFDVSASQLFIDPLFSSGKYQIAGEVMLVNAAGVGLTNVPVSVGPQ